VLSLAFTFAAAAADVDKTIPTRIAAMKESILKRREFI